MVYTSTASPNNYNKSAIIFDFDNTLVKTECIIKITDNKTGRVFDVHSDQYELYENDRSVAIDLRYFEQVSDYKIITDTFSRLVEHHANQIETHILSARHCPNQIYKFCNDNNLHNTKITTLGIKIGDNNGLHKANYIRKLIKQNNYSDIEFYDDRLDCVSEVKNLSNEFENTIIRVYRILDSNIITKF